MLAFRPVARQKTGGRQAGTLNKATAEWRAFLQGIFRDAMAAPEFRARLLTAVIQFELDPNVFKNISAYAFGAPPKQVEVTHRRASLAQLVSGQNLPPDEPDDDQDVDPFPEGLPPTPGSVS